MESISEKIFILETKESKRGITYCIGVYRLGTPLMEYILGETDNDKTYQKGDEVSYIYNAEYTNNLQYAIDWLNNIK